MEEKEKQEESQQSWFDSSNSLPFPNQEEEDKEKVYERDEVAENQMVQQLVPQILSRLKIGKDPCDPDKVRRMLEQMKQPHLYDKVMDILVTKRPFNSRKTRSRNKRQRGR